MEEVVEAKKPKKEIIVEKIKEACQNTFSDLWEFNESTSQLMILFPEIIITNSKGLSNKIEELWVRIDFNPTTMNFLYDGICGYRTRYTLKEFQSSYAHSHLPSGTQNCAPNSFPGFCLGHDTMKIMCRELYAKFNAEKFELFLHVLDNYVRWESLEGGPYRRMEGIRYINVVNNNLSQATLENYYKKYIAKLTSFPFSFNSNHRGSIIVNPRDTEFESTVTSICDAENLVSKTESGDYVVGYDKTSLAHLLKQYNSSVSSHIIKFRGKSYVKTVYVSEDLIDKDDTKVAHPQLTEYIANRISKEMTNYYLNRIKSRNENSR